MKLSIVYQKVFWMMVYHTQPDSEEVELVTNKLFETKKKALKWYARKFGPDHFIQPEAVQVFGLHKLELRPDRMLDSSSLDRHCWTPEDERKTIVPPSLDDEETFGLKAQR